VRFVATVVRTIMALSAAPSMEFAEPTLVVIRVVSGSELEPLARELCIRLNQYYGISCILSVADDESAGGRSWVRESMGFIAKAGVFIPFVDARWMATEQTLLELALALRRCLHTREQPIVLPIISSTLAHLYDLWAQDPRPACVQNLGPVLEGAVANLPLVRSSAFHMYSDIDAAEMTVRVINFMRALDFDVEIEAMSVATGGSIRAAYTACLGEDKKPNTGLMKVLKAQVDDVGGAARCQALLAPRLYIADAGTIALAAVLGMMPRLVRLNLAGNGINNNGIVALCTQLRYHPSIAHINVSNNIFSIPGAAELLLLLRDNRRIVDLDVTDNFIQSKVWEKRLETELDANRSKAGYMTTERLARDGKGSEKSAKTRPSLPPHVIAATFVAASDNSGTVDLPVLSHWRLNLRLTSPSSLTISLDVSRHQPPKPDAPAAKPSPVFNFTQRLDSKGTTTTTVSSPNLVSVVAKYLLEFVDMHVLKFTRVNGRVLKFVLEGAGAGTVENIVESQVLPWLQLHTEAAKKIPEDIVNGEQRFFVRVERAFDDPNDDYFVETELGLWQLQTRLFKSLAQMYRASDITRSSGNVVDELSNLVSMLASLDADAPGVDELRGPGQEGDADAHKFADALHRGDGLRGKDSKRVQHAEEATLQAMDAVDDVHAAKVLSTWGRGGAA
jgi:hypothetical protein